MSTTFIFAILLLCLFLKPSRVESVHHDSSIVDAPQELDEPKSPVSDGVRAPHLELEDNDGSLLLVCCALLEHDGSLLEASPALSRELEHPSSVSETDPTSNPELVVPDNSVVADVDRVPELGHDRSVPDVARSRKREVDHHHGPLVVAGRSHKRVKFALAQRSHTVRIRLAYSSLRQPHRRRQMLSVCRGGLDAMDILTPLLASMSVQMTGSNAVDILSSGFAALSLQPAGSDAVDCDELGAGFAALSIQPTGSDGMECESLSFALTALSLASKKRNREEVEDDDTPIIVDARLRKRVRLSPASRPERVPYSSIIAPRRRVLLARRRAGVPVIRTVAVTSPSVVICIVAATASAPIPVVAAPTVLGNITNTINVNAETAAETQAATNSKGSRNGGGVERTIKTSSGRENASPFPVSCMRKGSLARGIY